jgi:hypothetical protein
MSAMQNQKNDPDWELYNTLYGSRTHSQSIRVFDRFYCPHQQVFTRSSIIKNMIIIVHVSPK